MAFLFAPASRADEKPIAWKTGPAIQRQLASPVTLRWAGVELRPALENLAEIQEVAIFLDRRVDPNQSIDLSISQESLGAAFDRIAETKVIGTSLLGPVVYFGPTESAKRLRTLAELRRDEIRKLDGGRRGAFIRAKSWKWDMLSTPRELVEQLEKEGGIAIRGKDRVPHDLWPACRLPAMTLADRLTLLLAGFDLTYRAAPDGRSVEIVSIAEPVEIARQFNAPTNAGEIVAKLARFLPDARIESAGGKIVVHGRLEDCEAVDRALKGEPIRRTVREPANPAGGKQVYTLTVENKPIGAVVLAIGQQIGLEVEFDKDAIGRAGTSPEKLVSFQVKNASLDELLKAALEPAGLTFRMDGKKVIVGPAGK